ncbi:MAG TPA: N-6 DNA methylase [Thermoanaerobaculia bacterium]|nr:N-6 DNA methylase [Thermoanaerobaculia bacterium]
MITASRLNGLRGLSGVFTLLHELGYPVVAPIVVDAEEWRGAGIQLDWNGSSTLHLAARTRRFDLFVLQSDAGQESIGAFLRSYREYNVLTKSVLVKSADEKLSIYDLAGRTLRRLDVDLAQPSVHAVDRLNLLQYGDDLPRIFDIALDRESITRRFFERFRDAVRDISEVLDGPQDVRDAEALLVMSRLLFLSFVQVKGWLNEERRFLFDRINSHNLGALFFGCLNTPVEQRDDAARKLGRIPYLNGGLFEPSAYEQRRELKLPDALLKSVIADVFERFDFSVDEGDAAGTHVDPEMLGRVFESLMAGDERTASGSFYTPREIVDALTSRGIAEWVGNMRDPNAALRKLETITVLDPACGSGAFLLSALHTIERLTRELAERAEEEVPPDLRRRIVERSLFGVDLKPEAVRLCELRLWLAIVSATHASIEDVTPLPNLDRNILQGNSLLSPTDFLGDARASIYRDWRNSVVAQADLVARYRNANRDERPALARLVRENDRHLASELLARAIDADEREMQLLAVPDPDLFGRRAPHSERCRELQERIASTRKTLEKVEDGELGFFSFDVHFAHVIAQGGFAVVAGNPPWVRNSRIDPAAKKMFADRYSLFRRGGGAAFHQPDLSVAFFERAMSLAARDGVVAMLMPAKIVNAGYASGLRRFVWERASIVAIDDWSGGHWFDADTFPLGLTVRPLRAPNGVAITSCGQQFSMPQRELPVGDASSEWALVPPDAAAILKRLRVQHASFAEVIGRTPIMGVKTGANGTFFLQADRVTRGKLITPEGVEVPLSAVARCVRGRDVRRWTASDSVFMLWPPADGWKTPPRWLEELAEVRGVDPVAFRLAYVKPEHAGIKVVWKDLSRGMSAAVLPEAVNVDGRAVPLVPNQTLYSIDTASLNEAYAIAALLNSTVADALLLCIAERAKDAHFRYFGRTVARIPLPRVPQDSEAWARLVRAGRRAEHEVDDVVSSLYGVTTDELDVLRRYVDRRLERDVC